jgi:thioredoxin-like negative regulator of GroEL
VNYIAINVDNLGEVGQKYGVRSIPCVVAIDARGREKGRKVGVLRPDEIREMEETVTRQ